jgi:DNA polymerase-1
MTDTLELDQAEAAEALEPEAEELTIAYCTTVEQVEIELADIIADAAGRPIGLDIETTATLAEVDRLRRLELRQAELVGERKASKKAKAPPEEIADIEAEQKLLKAKIKYCHAAGLDPHRARVRSFQIYGGGSRVAMIDLFRTGPEALRLLDGLDITAHGAAFEIAHLEAAGVELGATHCSMQMARLTLGERSMRLSDAVNAHLGVELDKTEQRGDWSTPTLTDQQIEYAALDAVMAFRLAERIIPVLGPQTSAYEIQVGVTPAVARMRTRGVLLDLTEHATHVRRVGLKRSRLRVAYKTACLRMGLPALAAKTPTTPALKRAALEAILSSDELMAWQRTKKTGALSSARTDLRRAAHYPPIKLLARLSKTDALLSTFGVALTALVSPVTGRIHANYRVAADTTGRAACAYPNLQSAPRSRWFRHLFKAATGCKLVGGDYTYMEMRATAHVSNDRRMTLIFINGEDPHKVTAAGMSGKTLDEVTKAERQAAKPVNFGIIFGCGARGLMVTAWKTYGVILTDAESSEWLHVFARTFPDHNIWRRRHADQCEREGRIVMGRDASRGIGRIFPLSRMPAGKSGYTRSANYPIQGACDDASMRALELVDQRLFEHGIAGGPVLWLHDEIICEVPEADAPKAKEILEQSMVEAFAEIFPGAPLKDLVEVKIGDNWSEVK